MRLFVPAVQDKHSNMDFLHLGDSHLPCIMLAMGLSLQASTCINCDYFSFTSDLMQHCTGPHVLSNTDDIANGQELLLRDMSGNLANIGASNRSLYLCRAEVSAT